MLAGLNFGLYEDFYLERRKTPAFYSQSIEQHSSVDENLQSSNISSTSGSVRLTHTLSCHEPRVLGGQERHETDEVLRLSNSLERGQ